MAQDLIRSDASQAAKDGIHNSRAPVQQGGGQGRERARKARQGLKNKKSESQLTSYWSKITFTGKGQPPQRESNDTSVKELVASNPNLIGYIDSSMVDDSVKVIFRMT